MGPKTILEVYPGAKQLRQQIHRTGNAVITPAPITHMPGADHPP